MAKNPNDVAFVSPFGIARYPHLDVADTRFDEEGKFKLGVILDAEDADAFEALCLKVFAEAFPKNKSKNVNIPLKEDDDGNRYIVASSKYRPKVYNGKKAPVEGVGGGSKLRIAGVLHPYDKGANKGVTIYLYDVQVTKLIASGQGGAMDVVADEDDDTEVSQDEQDSIDI